MTETDHRHIHVFKSRLTGEWYYRFISENGEAIGASEGYRNREDLLQTVSKYFAGWRIEVEEPEGGE